MGGWRLPDRPVYGDGVVVPFPAVFVPKKDYNGAAMRLNKSPKDATRAFFSLGDWEVRPNNNELASGLETRHLEPMVMDLLVFMAERAPEVVSKNAIIDSVWEGRFISEGTLTNTIAELRRVLGDDARSPRYIETIPKRGYRVVAEVSGAGTVAIHGRDSVMTFGPPTEELDPRRVLVLPFENRTGDSARDVIGLMVMDWLSQGLSRWAVGDVVPSSTAREMVRSVSAPQAADPVLAAAGETGAGVIVWGSYYLEGDSIFFQANITDATEGRLLWAVDPIAGRQDAVVEIIENLRQQVAGLLACHFASSTDELGQVGLDGIGAPPPMNAYREFLEGRERIIGDMAAAIGHFRRAVELAPGFSTAWANLVVCYFNTGEYSSAAAAADEMEAECPLDRPAQMHTRAFIRARLDGRWAEALSALQEIEILIPHDAPTKMLVATAALRAGRPEVTVDACSAIRLRGRFVRHPASIVRCDLIASALHMLGEYERELEQIRKVAEVIPRPLAVLHLEVRALAAAGRFQEVECALDRSLSTPTAQPMTGRLMVEAALEFRAHGHHGPSLEMAGRAITWVERRGPETVPKEVMRDALCVAGRWHEAREIVERTIDDTDLRAMGMLGWLSERIGDTGRPSSIEDVLSQATGPYLYGEPLLQRACIEAHRGELESALNLVSRAFGAGLPYDIRLHRDLGLEPLWEETRFTEIIEP